MTSLSSKASRHRDGPTAGDLYLARAEAWIAHMQSPHDPAVDVCQDCEILMGLALTARDVWGRSQHQEVTEEAGMAEGRLARTREAYTRPLQPRSLRFRFWMLWLDVRDWWQGKRPPKRPLTIESLVTSDVAMLWLRDQEKAEFIALAKATGKADGIDWQPIEDARYLLGVKRWDMLDEIQRVRVFSVLGREWFIEC